MGGGSEPRQTLSTVEVRSVSIAQRKRRNVCTDVSHRTRKLAMSMSVALSLSQTGSDQS